MKTAIVLLISICLAACASRPDPKTLASADYGPRPTNTDQIVKKHLETALKDPFSAKVRLVHAPRKDWLNKDQRGKPVFGWGTCYSVNSKNSFGAYTGFELMYFLIYRGKVVEFRGEEPHSKKVCERLLRPQGSS